jgi:hypothetical protein
MAEGTGHLVGSIPGDDEGSDERTCRGTDSTLELEAGAESRRGGTGQRHPSHPAAFEYAVDLHIRATRQAERCSVKCHGSDDSPEVDATRWCWCRYGHR